MVTEADIQAGLLKAGIHSSSAAIVHSSLRSFGQVEGGAPAVCRALLSSGATLLFPAGSGDKTGVPAPPGLLRPNNCPPMASSWQEFDEVLSRAVPFADNLPVDKELGLIPETIRRSFAHERSPHPLMSYMATGRYASELLAAQKPDWPLGPLEALAELDGDVLLMGVDHTSNTAIHLAEQRLGRSRFFRYTKIGSQSWAEIPNIPGDSHRFDEIEPHCRPFTQEVLVGACRMRRIKVRDVLAAAERLILANPAAMLCEDPECRCYAALQQRLAVLSREES